jgi:hypothetical protein
VDHDVYELQDEGEVCVGELFAHDGEGERVLREPRDVRRSVFAIRPLRAANRGVFVIRFDYGVVLTIK